MSKMISSTRPFCLCIHCSVFKHASHKYCKTRTVYEDKMWPNLNKMFTSCFLISPMPCYFIAMQIVHHSSWHDCLLVAFYSYACALYLCWPSFVWFFFE